MIEIKNIYKAFGEQKLFIDLNLTINKGEKISIIGPSGCGKSSIIRYIFGLKNPDKGTIIIDGKDISKLNKKELIKIRLNMGLLFQESALFDSLNVEENIAFPLIENFDYTLFSSQKKINYVLDLVGLSGYNKKMTYQLSGGQKKRVGLARSIITEPKYIFYDEPTTGLDPIMSTTIENVILDLNKELNITSVIVSHQNSTILRTSDLIYIIDNFKLLPPELTKTVKTSKNDVIRKFLDIT